MTCPYNLADLKGTNELVSYLKASDHNLEVNYYCMNCGIKHDQAKCPKCGSRIKEL
jgi:rubrerythrin